ncbi:hypothetical protein SAMN04488245_12648 [Alloyangia pacifica]|uniref:Uncharacterized protein n=2 Tax=Alloyangia pacifica TaxID=311180 RepID=A0A1I6WIQ7_9RHOB|nr:hypothetical protein SAMN04488245_12648 [Alloyangia pacifica]SFT25870.1 hypothetical protein SAMN04488050_12348 [Alloyangia pacifica]
MPSGGAIFLLEEEVAPGHSDRIMSETAGSSECRGFELRRQIDGLVYRFERRTDASGRIGYKRSDGDFWIVWHAKLGWIAGDRDGEEVFGRPWDQLTGQSSEVPPEGVWVSRKGAKSYVYDLVHV